MEKWFKSCQTAEELKRRYRQLAIKYHPDNGGDAEIFKEISAEYTRLFKVFGSRHYSEEKKTYYEKKTDERPEDFVNLINILIKLKGIRIEIIGSFVWVSGDTKPYKETLKQLHFRWHSQKKCWYKAPDGYYKRYHGKTYTMDEIKQKYGCQYATET